MGTDLKGTGLIDAAIYKAQMSEMRWGVDDCCCFVARVVMAHGGPDIAEPFRPWDSVETASAKLREYAGGGLLEACQKRAAELSLTRIERLRAGAIGLVTDAGGHMMALAVNNRWLVRTAHGVGWLRPSQTIFAWDMPCLPH